MKTTQWKKYTKHPLREHAICFYQKEIVTDIYANILVYGRYDKNTYALEIQIPEEVSIIKQTIDIEVFTFPELDFERFEKIAKKLITKLIYKKQSKKN